MPIETTTTTTTTGPTTGTTTTTTLRWAIGNCIACAVKWFTCDNGAGKTTSMANVQANFKTKLKKKKTAEFHSKKPLGYSSTPLASMQNKTFLYQLLLPQPIA